MDRVREAVFSSLGERTMGARVLDLFAGSGSYALEALSRGAAEATIVEKARPAIDAFTANARKARLSARVVAGDVFDFLRRAPANSYDLIFADPPYAKRPQDEDHASRLLAMEELLRCLAHEGIFLLETHAKWQWPQASAWDILLERTYGDAAVRLLQPKEDQP
jgi:16S rRNA (guanine966-N2)-methyltransferase